MVLRTRKGYLHALEGVLAGLIIAVYLTSVISTPEPLDWGRVHQSAAAQEIVTALDQTGELDRMITEDDEESLQAMMSALDGTLAYRMRVSGMAPPHIEYAVVGNPNRIDAINGTYIVSANGRTVTFRGRHVDPTTESLANYSMVIVVENNEAQVAAHAGNYTDVLRRGGIVFFMVPINSISDGGYFDQLGFREVSYPTTGTFDGVELDTDTVQSAPEHRISTYYAQTPVQPVEIIPGTPSIAELIIRQTEMTANIYLSGEVSFSTDAHTTRYTEGAIITLQGNPYLIDSVSPLRLLPRGRQVFSQFTEQDIVADTMIGHHTGERFQTPPDSVGQVTGSEISQAAAPLGTPETVCSLSEQPYLTGQIDVGGTLHEFVLVNQDLYAPCDDQYDVAYIDWSGDGDVADGPGMTPAGFPGEGPYPHRSSLNLSDDRYTVDIRMDGSALELIGPSETIGGIPMSTGAVDGNGRALLFDRREVAGVSCSSSNCIGDDERTLILSIVLSEGIGPYTFTTEQQQGDIAAGYQHPAQYGKQPSQPYILDTAWWQ